MSGVTLDRNQKDWLIEFINHNTDHILYRWFHLTRISKDDVYYNGIRGNAQTTIQLMTNYFQDPNKMLIRCETEKIVKERVEANVNLNHFVKNINLGHQVVIDLISEATAPESTKLGGILAVSRFFDSFLFYVVTHFTEMKDRIIKEKTKFIQEMHSDRLTILGQIAASFAHEFRNPLTSIKGFISLLERNVTTDEQSKYYFSIVNKEMDSLEDKVSQFLYLSKMKGLGDDMDNFSLSKLLEEMISFMYPRFVVEAIKVNRHITKNMMVYGVKEQVKQVVLNIINNAVEELSEYEGERHIDIYVKKEKGTASVIISNNGREIPPHILENIFEPFISTKELGTGLGLAVCKQIIEKHEGQISVESEDGKTSFKFTLPLYIEKI